MKKIEIKKSGTYVYEILNNEKIFIILDKKNLNVELNFNLKKNSKIKLFQYIKNVKKNNTTFFLDENCNVENIVFYDFKNINSENLSKVIHKKKIPNQK